MYLSGKHIGIQAQHSTARLMYKYLSGETSQRSIVEKWVTQHETTIALRGGDHTRLEILYDKIVDLGDRFPYPYAEFSEPGLNYSLTSIAVILDQYALDAFNAVRKEGSIVSLNSFFEEDVAEVLYEIMNMRLAHD